MTRTPPLLLTLLLFCALCVQRILPDCRRKVEVSRHRDEDAYPMSEELLDRRGRTRGFAGGRGVERPLTEEV